MQSGFDLAPLAEFADFLFTSPLAALMLLSGAVLMIVSMGVFGYLSLGGVVSAIIPAPSGQGQQREAR